MLQVNNNITKYLQGDASNNQIGTIIAVKRTTKNKHSLLGANPFSLLLYFDQRIGRIERYLANSKDVANLKSKTPIVGEAIHIVDNDMSFKSLNNGRVNNKFFNVFLLELFRDYLYYNNSYKTCDMNYLRNHTYPKEIKQATNLNGVTKNVALGTGRVLYQDEWVEGAKTFTAHKYVQLDPDKALH